MSPNKFSLRDSSNPLPYKDAVIFGRFKVRQMEAQAKHDMEVAFSEKDRATWPWENLCTSFPESLNMP